MAIPGHDPCWLRHRRDGPTPGRLVMIPREPRRRVRRCRRRRVWGEDCWLLLLRPWIVIAPGPSGPANRTPGVRKKRENQVFESKVEPDGLYQVGVRSRDAS